MTEETPKPRISRRRLLRLAGAAGVSAVAARLWLGRPRPLPPPSVHVSEAGEHRLIESNGVPDHPTGTFPNPDCPLWIRPQRHAYRVARNPVAAAALTPIGFWEFGIARNGIPLDPAGPHFMGDAATGWQFEVLSPVASPRLGIDEALAHVQPGGAYHYHGLSPALLRPRRGADGRSEGMRLLGWAADGFPVYGPFAPKDPKDPQSPLVAVRPSYRLREGARRAGGPGGKHDGTFVEDHELVAGLGDLDAANGRTGWTPEHPEGIYHYFLTPEFPFIPRFFRGTPDPTFGQHTGGPGLAGVPPALRAYRG